MKNLSRYFFEIGSSYGRPIYSPCLTHYYTLQYLHINISKTVYRISFDKYIYASVTHGGKTTKLKIRVNTNIREGNETTKAIKSYIMKANVVLIKIW